MLSNLKPIDSFKIYLPSVWSMPSIDNSSIRYEARCYHFQFTNKLSKAPKNFMIFPTSHQVI